MIDGRPPKNTRRPNNMNSGNSCKDFLVCKKSYNISIIEFLPFHKGMEQQVNDIFNDCCGHCGTENRTFNVAQLNATSLANADIIYPVAVPSSTIDLYGLKFLPLFDAPVTYYVVKGVTPNETIDQMMEGFFALWPLLIICLLLASLAGFIGWLLDTWKNEDEFPRSFFIGFWEGVWWAFVSMTTVGYGDKAPRSAPARVFSIVWIILGISICSMLTASLASIITDAEKDPSSDMTGEKVGVLKHRNYDAKVVAKYCGILDAYDHDNATAGIDHLVKDLKSNTIKAFLVDKPTFFFYLKETNKTKLEGVFIAEKDAGNEKFSYGLLVKEDIFKFFEKYIHDNSLYFRTCMELMLNSESKKDKNKRNDIFSTESDLFQPVSLCCVGLLAAAFIFGILFELKRRRCLKRSVKQEENGTSS